MNLEDYKKAAEAIINEIKSNRLRNTGADQKEQPFVDHFRYISREEFDKKSQQELSKINDKTTEIEFTAIMKRIFALLGDGHSRLRLGLKYANLDQGMKLYEPVDFETGKYKDTFDCVFKIFDNTAYAINNEKTEYLKIKTINGKPVEQIKTDLTALISCEAEPWKDYGLEQLLCHAPSYQMINANNPNNRHLTIVGTDKNGKEQTILVGQKQIIQNDKAVPPKKFYEFKLSPDGRLYVNYFGCANNKEYPFEKFIDDIKNAIGKKQITGAVFDLRNNQGGIPGHCRPLIDYLKKNFHLDQNNSVILGNGQTYSAGVTAVTSFKKAFNSMLIGEPLGQCTDLYGYCKNSKMYDVALGKVIDFARLSTETEKQLQREGFPFSLSSVLYDKSQEQDRLTFVKSALSGKSRTIKCGPAKKVFHGNPRQAIMPDILVKQTLEDYINGNDRQMKAAQDYLGGKLNQKENIAGK